MIDLDTPDSQTDTNHDELKAKVITTSQKFKLKSEVKLNRNIISEQNRLQNWKHSYPGVKSLSKLRNRNC